MRMEQDSDTLGAYFCLCLEFFQGRFEVADFRSVPLCPCLVLEVVLLLELHLPHVIVLEPAYFCMWGLFVLFRHLTSTNQLFCEPLLLLLCLIAQLQNLSFHLSFGVDVLVTGLDRLLVCCGVGL